MTDEIQIVQEEPKRKKGPITEKDIFDNPDLLNRDRQNDPVAYRNLIPEHDDIWQRVLQNPEKRGTFLVEERDLTKPEVVKELKQKVKDRIQGLNEAIKVRSEQIISQQDEMRRLNARNAELEQALRERDEENRRLTKELKKMGDFITQDKAT